MLDKTLDYIKKLKKLDIAEELAEIGESVVIREYSTADGQTDGFTTSVIKADKNVTLSVSGNDVMFREFGAGVNTAENYDLSAIDTSELPPIENGSYSDSVNGMYKNTGYQYWYWNRKRYTGIRPTMGMYLASQEMRKQMARLIKEKL